MKGRLPIILGFAFSLLLLLDSGCATKGLWDQQSFREPSPNGLQLAFDPQRKDMLVCYEELNEHSAKTKPRAYYLFENEKRVNSQRKPAFVNPGDMDKLVPIPVVGAAPLSGADAGRDFCAVAITNAPDFKLYSKGRELGEFHLPVYKDGMWQTEKALLLPLAVGADATIVGGYIGALYIRDDGPVTVRP